MTINKLHFRLGNLKVIVLITKSESIETYEKNLKIVLTNNKGGLPSEMVSPSARWRSTLHEICPMTISDYIREINQVSIRVVTIALNVNYNPTAVLEPKITTSFVNAYWILRLRTQSFVNFFLSLWYFLWDLIRWRILCLTECCCFFYIE